jgi:cell division protein FtsZ
MTINLQMPDITELKPRITVYGVGGGGCNAVNNMIEAGLQGVEFVVANTDAQALTMSKADRLIQMGVAVTEGLGAGSQPEIGRAAAEEAIDEVNDHLAGAHMAFITAGMGGGTGTGAAPVVARAAREAGILTVGVVTKPFQFEGQRRMRIAEQGIQELQKHVDTLIVIPNQNLFRIANEKTTFADAFAMADEVLYSGVACITDLMVKDGLINLDFADVRSVMREMGKAMMGTGEASGDKRAVEAAEAAISNPLLDDVSMQGAQGLLISITGGKDMTLFEVDEAASRVRQEVDSEANIIFGATFDERLEGTIRVSVVATGIDVTMTTLSDEDLTPQQQMAELTQRLKTVGQPAPANGAQLRSAGQPGAAETLEDELAVPQFAAAGAAQPQPQAMAQPQRQSASDPGVRIGPFRPDPSLVAAQREPVNDLDMPVYDNDQAAPSGPYIPPAAEHPEDNQPRMPKVEDFPAIAQRQMASAGQPSGIEEEHRPRGLLARLAQGLGKREDDEGEVQVHSGAGSRPMRMEVEPRIARPADRVAAPQPRRIGEPGNPAGTLDPHGRVAGTEPIQDDDQLEIPAFLRRQSS